MADGKKEKKEKKDKKDKKDKKEAKQAWNVEVDPAQIEAENKNKLENIQLATKILADRGAAQNVPVRLVPCDTIDPSEEEYYSQRVRRNPYTGKVFLQDVNPNHDFVIVNLGSEEYVEGQPVHLVRDPNSYLFLPQILETRSWLLAELGEWERSPEASILREKEALIRSLADLTKDVQAIPARTTEELVALALQDKCIERSHGIGGGSFGASSPIYSYAALCFTANWTGNTTLALISVIAFFWINTASLTCNNGNRFGAMRAYEAHRLLSLPIRLVIIAIAGMEVFAMSNLIQAGMGLEVFAVLATFLLGVIDFRHDVMAAAATTLKTSFEVVDVLPGQVYVCRKIGGGVMLPSTTMLPERIVGPQLRKTKGLVIIVNVRGLLVELSELKFKHFEALRGNFMMHRTKTFDEICTNYIDVKERMVQEEEEAAAVALEKERRAELERIAKEKERQRNRLHQQKM
jgi:hypothetical protein